VSIIRIQKLEIIMSKTVEIAKKGGCPENHLGIKNRIKKIPVD
jgi:hypothetical protein